jgi:hypothetical protein
MSRLTSETQALITLLANNDAERDLIIARIAEHLEGNDPARVSFARSIRDYCNQNSESISTDQHLAIISLIEAISASSAKDAVLRAKNIPSDTLIAALSFAVPEAGAYQWLPGTEVRQAVTQYTVSVLPEEYTSESYIWDITVRYRGNGLWSINRVGERCLSRSGEWVRDQPDSRYHIDPWIHEHRFTETEALERATKAAPDVTINGLNPAQYIEWCAKKKTKQDS